MVIIFLMMAIIGFIFSYNDILNGGELSGYVGLIIANIYVAALGICVELRQNKK